MLKLLFRREKNNWNKICVQKRRKREREREKSRKIYRVSIKVVIGTSKPKMDRGETTEK